MSNFKKVQLNEINAFLEQKGLVNYINDYLLKNDLVDYEVTSIKLKQKTNEKVFLTCAPGYKKIEVCTRSGKCESRCVAI